MSNMLLLESNIENMGLCRLLNHQYNNIWMAITLAGRTILVRVEGDKAVEIKK